MEVVRAFARPLFVGAVSAASSEEMISRSLKVSQAARKGFGVFCSPMPMTNIPASLSLWASLVKSESLDTRQKPSTFPEYRISMASMIMAESVAFLPVV